MYPFPRFRGAAFPPFFRVLQVESQDICDIYEIPVLTTDEQGFLSHSWLQTYKPFFQLDLNPK